MDGAEQREAMEVDGEAAARGVLWDTEAEVRRHNEMRDRTFRHQLQMDHLCRQWAETTHTNMRLLHTREPYRTEKEEIARKLVALPHGRAPLGLLHQYSSLDYEGHNLLTAQGICTENFDVDGMELLCKLGAHPWGFRVARGVEDEAAPNFHVRRIEIPVLAKKLRDHELHPEDVIYWLHRLIDFGVCDLSHQRTWEQLFRAVCTAQRQALGGYPGIDPDDYDHLFWYCLAVMGNDKPFYGRPVYDMDAVSNYIVSAAGHEHHPSRWRFDDETRRREFHFFTRLIEEWLSNRLMAPAPDCLEKKLRGSGRDVLIEMGRLWTPESNRNPWWHDTVKSVGCAVSVYMLRNFGHGFVPQVIDIVCAHYAHAMRRYRNPQQIAHFLHNY